jgi:hypothetical protein
MKRREFIQGTAAGLAAWRFVAARAQDYGSRSPYPSETVIYTSNEALLQRKQFNPLDRDLKPQALHELGLPYPDPNSPLYSIWKQIFDLPLFFARSIDIEAEQAFELNPRFVLPLPSINSTRYETSRNWSGAYIMPRNGNMFTEIAGAWTVPTVPSSAQPYQSSSIWVGLDGQRKYFNSSLPQIGTTQEFNVDTSGIEYKAWYQWWVPGKKHERPRSIMEVSLTAGDRVFCDVQVVDPIRVNVSITKLGTTNQVWSKTLLSPIAPLTGGMRPRISGATAQWIVERPMLPNTDDLLQLVDYGLVDFSSCSATAASGPGVTAAEYQTLDSARFIRMYEQLDGPPRTTRLSWPSRTVPDQQDAFKVAYVGP